MIPARMIPWTVAAAAGVIVTSGRAQADTSATQIKEAALTTFASSNARSTKASTVRRRLIFDPTVLRGWWDRGIRRDTTPPPTPRGSTEVAMLARALSGSAVGSADLENCGRGKSPGACSLLVSEVTIVSISEPIVRGDSASVLLRSGPPDVVGNWRVLVGRTVFTYLARLTRTNGRWNVRCFDMIATDFVTPAERVAAMCGP